MIRVIYKWRVPLERQAEFEKIWQETTRRIHETTSGARGSFCLASIDDPTEVLTVALWDSEGQWREFIENAKATSMSGLHDIAEQISAKPYIQLGDETV